jgi:hypothetical protein
MKGVGANNHVEIAPPPALERHFDRVGALFDGGDAIIEDDFRLVLDCLKNGRGQSPTRKTPIASLCKTGKSTRRKTCNSFSSAIYDTSSTS